MRTCLGYFPKMHFLSCGVLLLLRRCDYGRNSSSVTWKSRHKLIFVNNTCLVSLVMTKASSTRSRVLSKTEIFFSVFKKNLRSHVELLNRI